MPAPTFSATAAPVIHSGYVQAAAVALLAAVVITAAAILLARKRLAWDTWLDMPVGLATPRPAGTETACQILLGESGLRHPGPYTGSTEQGWLVVLGITNPGRTPVRSRDFSIPLTFAFPGRQIHAIQIHPEQADRTARQPASAPTIRISAANSAEPGRSGRMHLADDYVLRPNHSYTVMLVLSGIPPAHARRIQQGGSLASGKIIPGPESW